MKKVFLSLLLSTFWVVISFAQEDEGLVNLDSLFPIDPYHYQLAADSCRQPIFEAHIIQYKDGVQAYLKLLQGFSDSEIQYISADGETGTASFAEGKLVLDGLRPDMKYALHMPNSCGVMSDVGVLDTKTSLDDAVTVSEPFYNEITRYLKRADGTPFDQFLNGLETIDMHERTAFVQQFFYAGQPFETERYTTVPPLPDGGGKDTCFCNSIRTSPMARPAKMNFTTGTITDYSQPGSEPTPTSLGGDGNTRTWYWLNNKGAAKWHNLYTEGYKSEKGVDYDKRMGWQDSSITSYQSSWIRMSLICLDGDKVPKECACEKTVNLYYKYDTRVKAVAELRYGTTGSKNSIAQVEDMAIVSYWEEFDPATFKIWDIALARAESHCDRTPNPAFWTTTATVAASAAVLTISILSATQGQDSTYSPQELAIIGAQIQQFFSSVATLINTPYQNPTDCDNVQENFGSMKGGKEQNLKPNTPMVIEINSFDKLYAGGRRAWYSEARVNSNFYLTSFIKHNAFDGTPRHCCSPRVGTWIVGSCDGPASTTQLMIEVAELLYIAGMNNLSATNLGNGRIVPKEYGTLSERSSLEDCNKIVVNPNGNGSGGKPALGRSFDGASIGTISHLSVLDVSGRTVATFNEAEISSFSTIKNLVETRLANIPPGVYIVRTVANGQISSQKIILH